MESSAHPHGRWLYLPPATATCQPSDMVARLLHLVSRAQQSQTHANQEGGYSGRRGRSSRRRAICFPARELCTEQRNQCARNCDTLDFHGTDVTLALRRPAKQPTAMVEGVTQSLAADYSAPISYYRPPNNILLVGLMAALRGGNYTEKTGLYFLQPYDPDRLPVVF